MILTDVQYAEMKMQDLLNGTNNCVLRSPMTINHQYMHLFNQELLDKIQKTQDILIITDDAFIEQVDKDFNTPENLKRLGLDKTGRDEDH